MEFNNYQIKRFLKLFLLVFAFLIGFFSLWYTNGLVQKLEDQERQKMKTWASATEELSRFEGEDATFLTEIVRANTTIPVILSKEDGEVLSYRNLDSSLMEDPIYVQDMIEYMKKRNEPIFMNLENFNMVMYYDNSTLLNQLRVYPYFQLSIIGLFLAVSYFAFSYSRRSEQNKVWAGMSKETAHQLGTPISSLIGWVDYLKESDSEINPKVLKEIEHDLNRLELITERFSKIGSEPVLEEQPLLNVLNESIDYINSRTSDKVNIYLENPQEIEGINIAVNKPLFAWVIENLCKNAVDAMEGEGSIKFHCSSSASKITIDVTDTGKGIPTSIQSTIFKPGFTTKRRGWGLGLSLVKRIIESYHKGRIFVKHSELGKGTTFRIELRNV